MGRIRGEKKISGRSYLLKDNTENVIIADSTAMLHSVSFNDYYVEQFTAGVTCLLNDYADLLGEGTAVEYSLTKKFSKVELRMLVSGEAYDIFKNGSEARKRQFERLTGLNLNTDLVSISYKYESGCNVVCVSLPLSKKRKPIYKNPMILAIVFGVGLGFLCLLLPDTVRDFIIDDVASEVKSVLLSVITGVMGPFIFISIVTSVVSLNSINDLTHLAFRILKRFVVCILFLMLVSIGVSVIFFNSFGTNEISFEPSYIIQLILSIFPTNVIDPFLNTNIPQLVVLGMLMGAALLILGDKVSGIKELLLQINQCVISVMKIILTVIPLIPFLSLLTIIGSGNASEILKGWKFIVAVYIVLSIAVAVKAVKTSLVTHIRIPDFWNKLKPIIITAFSTSSYAAPLNQMYEISDKELGIKPEFTSFWIPMYDAMFGIKTTVYLILGTLLAAEFGGTALTTSFLFIMLFVTLELSLASPGTTSSWTIMFEILGMSTDYVGLFAVYRTFTDNFSTAATITYSMLEQVEAAHKLGGMKEV